MEAGARGIAEREEADLNSGHSVVDRNVVDRKVVDRKVVDRNVVDGGVVDRRAVDRRVVDRERVRAGVRSEIIVQGPVPVTVHASVLEPPRRRSARDVGAPYALEPGRLAQEPVGVVILDEDRFRGLGLASVLLGAEGLTVVGIVAGMAELAETLDRARPQVVLMRTAAMPGLPEDGLGLGGSAKVVAVTMPTDSPEALVAAVPRAHGFVRGQDAPELIVEAVRVVAGGNIWISTGLWGQLMSDRRPPSADAAASLTVRERQVLEAVARGQSNKEIAEAMHLGLSTVKTHVAAIMGKAAARNRVELTGAAYRMGLLA